ncbi:hypothetical protein EXS54_01450 [Patescibacteria group bacterium]|nr:hypothetical protein [Patescibacteria group bacterium]
MTEPTESTLFIEFAQTALKSGKPLRPERLQEFLIVLDTVFSSEPDALTLLHEFDEKRSYAEIGEILGYTSSSAGRKAIEAYNHLFGAIEERLIERVEASTISYNKYWLVTKQS